MATVAELEEEVEQHRRINRALQDENDSHLAAIKSLEAELESVMQRLNEHLQEAELRETLMAVPPPPQHQQPEPTRNAAAAGTLEIAHHRGDDDRHTPLVPQIHATESPPLSRKESMVNDHGSKAAADGHAHEHHHANPSRARSSHGIGLTRTESEHRIIRTLTIYKTKPEWKYTAGPKEPSLPTDIGAILHGQQERIAALEAQLRKRDDEAARMVAEHESKLQELQRKLNRREAELVRLRANSSSSTSGIEPGYPSVARSTAASRASGGGLLRPRSAAAISPQTRLTRTSVGKR